MIPTLMSGVQLTAQGGPEVLVWSDTLPVAAAGPGEVLVQVMAAGANATDLNTRPGWYAKADAPDDGGRAGALDFPRIQGADSCGRVVALGLDVTGLTVGARVICAAMQPEPTPDNPLGMPTIGSENDGAFAQYCVVPARHLHDVSASPLSDTETGAMPWANGAALNQLARAGVQTGEQVQITGATGGAGYAAVQLAVLRGAHVTGQCSLGISGPVRAAGAEVLDRDVAPPKHSFDVVIDVIGGPDWPARIDALCPGGRCAVSGAIAGPMLAADLRTIYLNDLTLLGCTHPPAARFAEWVDLINAGTLRPLIANSYPLRDIAAAQADLQAGRYPGKLVLIP